MDVALAASPTARDHQTLPRLHQVGVELAARQLLDHGAERHRHTHVVPALAEHLLFAAVLTRAGGEAALVPKAKQGADVRIDDQDDVAAVAAVPAVGAPLRNVLLAPEAHATVAAAAGREA